MSRAARTSAESRCEARQFTFGSNPHKAGCSRAGSATASALVLNAGSVKLLKNGTLRTYKGFPHGIPTTEAETINADLLAFLKT